MVYERGEGPPRSPQPFGLKIFKTHGLGPDQGMRVIENRVVNRSKQTVVYRKIRVSLDLGPSRGVEKAQSGVFGGFGFYSFYFIACVKESMTPPGLADLVTCTRRIRHSRTITPGPRGQAQIHTLNQYGRFSNI